MRTQTKKRDEGNRHPVPEMKIILRTSVPQNPPTEPYPETRTREQWITRYVCVAAMKFTQPERELGEAYRKEKGQRELVSSRDPCNSVSFLLFPHHPLLCAFHLSSLLPPSYSSNV